MRELENIQEGDYVKITIKKIEKNKGVDLMEMKIKNGAFYVMEAGEEKALYDSVPNAIDALKTIVSQKKDLDPKKVNIFMVNIAKEKWEIVTIPWAEIAMELLKKK